MGRAGLINSGGASGSNDLAQAIRTAVINKRAGGMGLISGRKAFQKPMGTGVQLLNAIQDVYLDKDITIAWSPGQNMTTQSVRKTRRKYFLFTEAHKIRRVSKGPDLMKKI